MLIWIPMIQNRIGWSIRYGRSLGARQWLLVKLIHSFVIDSFYCLICVLLIICRHSDKIDCKPRLLLCVLLVTRRQKCQCSRQQENSRSSNYYSSINGISYRAKNIKKKKKKELTRHVCNTWIRTLIQTYIAKVREARLCEHQHGWVIWFIERVVSRFAASPHFDQHMICEEKPSDNVLV